MTLAVSRGRRAPLAVALAVALALVGGACGGGKDGEGAKPKDTTATSSAGEGGNGSGPDGGNGPGRGGGAGGNGSGPNGGNGNVNAGQPGPGRPARSPHAPAAGRYLYRTGQDGAGEQAFDVHDIDEPGTEFRQFHTWTDADSMTRSQILWRPDAKLVELEQRARPGGVGALCRWDPSLTDVRLPLTVGVSWSGEASCSETEGAKRTRRIDARVTGTDRATVEGRTVDVMVVERTLVETTVIKDERIVERRVTTDLYAAAQGLLIRSTGTAERTFRDRTTSAPSRVELKSLTPTPHPPS